MAVDIGTPSVFIRNQLIAEARNLGFEIAVEKIFAHLDINQSKSQYVAWSYPSGSRPAINPFA